MKRTMYILALIAMMGASFDSVKAQNQELSRSDSVSYAAGMNYTMGLIPYLSRQAGVDTTKMDDFIRGFQEFLKHTEDPTFKAYAAGLDIRLHAAHIRRRGGHRAAPGHVHGGNVL